MRLQLLPILSSIAALAPSVFAGVKFTSPAAGGNVQPGTISVAWEDDSTSPSLDDLSSYTLQLMVGGNTDTNSQPLVAIGPSQGSFASGSKVSGTVAATVAGPTKNGFYLKMIATATDGGTVTYYSSRFNMPGMTGTTPAEYATAAAAVSGTDGPDTVNAVANNAAAANAATGAAGGEYTVPYALQTGLTRYAPMQGVPPTKITLKNFTPMYSTSAYTIATTWLPKGSIVTTLTESQTFKATSIENTAAAQSMPTGDMAKFLARWKD
ncbi:hypothetical protein DOTSEDRAFT_71630 [Dothistroma septosporum NZE10]|uniref:Uncharacterized protein n=1 Tax=Dothistroma septosporum (strain NZE10 / CBS 128990) TaxID=675120 RepID=N1PLH8_DOTSN|nr:hypothetical protein DOTSEDRAFT_71630 [Dothistroma septosporum NZE10]